MPNSKKDAAIPPAVRNYVRLRAEPIPDLEDEPHRGYVRLQASPIPELEDPPPAPRGGIPIGGATYTGSPEQVATLRALQAGTAPEEARRRFALSGGRPEGAGLQLKRREKGPGEHTIETLVRNAPKFLGTRGGPVAGVAGAAAGGGLGELILRQVDHTTGQDETPGAAEAFLRGAEAGAKQALSPSRVYGHPGGGRRGLLPGPRREALARLAAIMSGTRARGP